MRTTKTRMRAGESGRDPITFPTAAVNEVSVTTSTRNQVSNESNPAFFVTLARWFRVDDPDGGEIIVLEFAEGGRVNVLTENPLLWIEPDRH